MRSLCQALLAALPLLSSQEAFAQRPAVSPWRPIDVPPAVRKPRAPEEIGRIFRSVFRDASEERLRQLSRDPEASVALPADAELFRRECLEAKDDAARLLALGRFLGRIEGRFLVSVPIRWQMALELEAGLSKRAIQAQLRRHALRHPDAVVERRGEWRPNWPRLKEVAGGALAPADLRLTEDEGALTIHQKETKWRLPHEVRRELERDIVGERVYRFLPARGVAYVACHNVFGDPFPLLCLDGRTERPRWKARSWGTWIEAARTRTGPWHHECELVVGATTLVVFGEVSYLYLEAFDAATGAARCRWAANFWDADR